MITMQLRPRGITDQAVLDAMSSLPRERFIPPRWQHLAYDDNPVPIGGGQTISQPYIVAYMTQALELASGDRVLEIGCGSGYQTAVLASMGMDVYAVEIVKGLVEIATQSLFDLEFSNTHIFNADGSNGLIEYAPYQGIVVTCASQQVPPALLEQLADGGRLIIPLDTGYPQTLTLFTRIGKTIQQKDLMGVIFVPMTGSSSGLPIPEL